jgi:hypothetical protein
MPPVSMPPVAEPAPPPAPGSELPALPPSAVVPAPLAIGAPALPVFEPPLFVSVPGPFGPEPVSLLEQALDASNEVAREKGSQTAKRDETSMRFASFRGRADPRPLVGRAPLQRRAPFQLGGDAAVRAPEPSQPSAVSRPRGARLVRKCAEGAIPSVRALRGRGVVPAVLPPRGSGCHRCL